MVHHFLVEMQEVESEIRKWIIENDLVGNHCLSYQIVCFLIQVLQLIFGYLTNKKNSQRKIKFN